MLDHVTRLGSDARTAPQARAALRNDGAVGLTAMTRDQARTVIFEWIEVFCNRRRLHSSLGYHSPADFESAA